MSSFVECVYCMNPDFFGVEKEAVGGLHPSKVKMQGFRGVQCQKYPDAVKPWEHKGTTIGGVTLHGPQRV